MSDNEDPRSDERLREVEAETERLASGAQSFRDENERGTRRGQETDYAFRLPPDVAEADRVRAGDDVEMADRQESAAETQRCAAETLRANAELLRGTARELEGASQALRENRDDVRDIQQNAEALRAQTDQARDPVQSTRFPEVDRGGDGHEGGNG